MEIRTSNATFFSLFLFIVFSGLVSSTEVTIFTTVTGQNPTYGYNASGPMLDIAFEFVTAKYPAIFANINLVRLYNAASVVGCVETGDIMHSIAGTMFQIMEKSKGFPIILSPGKGLLLWIILRRWCKALLKDFLPQVVVWRSCRLAILPEVISFLGQEIFKRMPNFHKDFSFLNTELNVPLLAT